MKKHKVKATKNKVVSFHYTLTGDDGEIIDSSVGKEPLSYLHGHSQIVSGLEKVLAGKTAGTSLKVTVPPEEGYGVRVEQMLITIPKDEKSLPKDLKVGDPLGMETDEGDHINASVVEITDTEVKIDCNHPLAGEILHFEVEITNIRSATPDELKHGHAHGAGGCGHSH